jgi:type II secretory pathway component GspD/PulD (secretin)
MLMKYQSLLFLATLPLIFALQAMTLAQGTPKPEPLPAKSAPPPLLPARGTYKLSGKASEMSVFAISTDAQELFTAIAGKADLKLVVDDAVSRKITINLEKKSAKQIIEAIVSAYGLSEAEVDDVIMISEGIPRSPSSYLLSDITSIPTKYVNAASARNLLPVFLQDFVKVNAEQNAVVLSAPTEVLTKFREDISQFDIPAAQILVEVQLVELTNTSADQLGLNLNYINGREGATIDPTLGTIRYQAITTLTNAFNSNLKALVEKSQAKVKASPRIATVSGRSASIFVGRQRYIATPIESSGQFGGSQNFIDSGVRLNITPFTGGQGQILIRVDAEVSTLSAPDAITNLPERSTRKANTEVRVGDGQTLVIGGLDQQETRDVRTKIPILGDIPWIGPSLFQTKNVRTSKTELVLLVTPRILSATGHLPEAEEKALKEKFLK